MHQNFIFHFYEKKITELYEKSIRTVRTQLFKS
jgi:hypothetical protein